jgi:hypothetical protein
MYRAGIVNSSVNASFLEMKCERVAAIAADHIKMINVPGAVILDR